MRRGRSCGASSVAAGRWRSPLRPSARENGYRRRRSRCPDRAVDDGGQTRFRCRRSPTGAFREGTVPALGPWRRLCGQPPLLPTPTRCGQPPATAAPNPLRPASRYSRAQPAAASLRLLPRPTRCGQPPAIPPTRRGQPPATPAPNPLRPASGYSRPQPAAASLPLLPPPTRCGRPPAAPAPNPPRPASRYSRPQPAAASLPLLPPPTRHSSERGNLVPRSPLRCGTLPVRASLSSPFVAGLSSPVRGEALEPNERAGNAQSISRTMKAHPSPGIADPFCRGEKSFAPAILRRPLLVILRSLRRRIQPAPSLSFPRRRESRPARSPAGG